MGKELVDILQIFAREHSRDGSRIVSKCQGVRPHVFAGVHLGQIDQQMRYLQVVHAARNVFNGTQTRRPTLCCVIAKVKHGAHDGLPALR